MLDNDGDGLSLLGVDLVAGPFGGGAKTVLDANGQEDYAGGKNDGRLVMDLGSNLVPYFVKNALGTQVSLPGNCMAGVDEMGRQCLQ